MAWRIVCKKGSQALNLWKDQALSSLKDAASGSHFEYAVNMASSSFGLLPGKSEMHKVDVYKSLPRQCFARYFHLTVGLLARTDGELSMRTSKKDMYVKRDNRTQPPVEAPYLPPKVTRSSKSLPDRTIEIFEGMTILELSKRTGKPISTLHDVLINVGEKVGSEFDPLGIDIAELVAMEVGANVKRLHFNEGTEVMPRPPVVRVMGHVDHGKTSLLDALRQKSLAVNQVA